MPKYSVTFIVDATITVEVVANNTEEAAKLANDEAYTPSLCHQCARILEVGDVTELHSIEEVA